MPLEQPVTAGVALSALEIASRMFLALLFGALIGIERQWQHKHAGVRTHALVSIGATAFGLISLLGFGTTNNPMLIAGGVVTGIGFIGGGVIMRQGGTIQGINTAATLSGQRRVWVSRWVPDITCSRAWYFSPFS